MKKNHISNSNHYDDKLRLSKRYPFISTNTLKPFRKLSS